MHLNHDSTKLKGVLATVVHIKETLFFLIFLINCRNHGRCNKKNNTPNHKSGKKGSANLKTKNSDYLTSLKLLLYVIV